MTPLSFGQLAFYGLTLAFPLVIFYYCLTADSKTETKLASAPPGDKDEKRSTTIMQPARTDLEPPKDDPFTQEQLGAYNGTDPSKPVYLAIKGTFVLSAASPHHTIAPSPVTRPLLSHAQARLPVHVIQERFLTCHGNARRMGLADHTRY
jgi:hypothetical protein